MNLCLQQFQLRHRVLMKTYACLLMFRHLLTKSRFVLSVCYYDDEYDELHYDGDLQRVVITYTVNR